MRRPTAGRLAQQAAIGLAAGLLGGLAMNLYAEATKRAREGHGVQPPQKKTAASDDPAEKAGAMVYKAFVGHKPRRRIVKRRLGTAMHYVFSGLCGMAYTLSSEFVPAMRGGFGLLYGTLVWLVADEAVTPALGLSKSPQEIPAADHLFALGGHGVFGATLEAAARLLPSSTHTS